MNEISISEFEARCLGLLEEVDRSGQPLTVLKRGKPIAVISPPPRDHYPQMGLMGTVKTSTPWEWECAHHSGSGG